VWGGDHTVAFQARGRGGAAAADGADDVTRPGRRVADRDAEVGGLHGLAGDQIRADRLHRIRGNGEADTGVGAAAGLVVDRDLHVRADHLAGLVDQRAAGVAVVDRGVGLDRVRDRIAVRRLDRA